MGYTKVEGDHLDLSGRKYQNDTYNKINRILFENNSEYNRYTSVVFPTGGGKTYMSYGLIQYMVQNLLKDEKDLYKNKDKLKVLFVSPTNAINEQFEKKIKDELQESGKKVDLDTFCYATDKNKDFSGYDLIIFDEVHRSGAENWEELIKNIISANSNAKILAITATPERSDQNTPMDNIAEFVYGKENILSRKQYMANEIYLEDALRDGLVVAPKNYDWDIALMGKTEFTNYLNQLTASFKNIDNKEELTEEEKEIQKSEIIKPIMDSFEINNEYGKNASVKLRNLTKFSQIIENNKIDINGPAMREYMMLNHKAFNISNSKQKKELETQIVNLEKELFNGSKSFRKIASGMQESRINLAKKAIKDIKGGIYIASINNFEGEILKKLYKTNDQYIESEKERIKYELEKAFENADDIEIHYENDKNKLDEISEKNKVEEQNGRKKVHIVLSKKLLDEGIHLDGTKGVFMYSKTNSEIVYSQRIGRTIHSPSEKDMQRPSVVDFACNRYNYLVNNYTEKFSPEYDLSKLEEICNWIEENNEIPDINKDYKNNQQEIRYGLILKKLMNRYTNMNNSGFNKSIDEIKIQIDRLISKYQISSKDLERKENLEPSESEILGQDFFELTSLQQRVNEYVEDIKSRNDDYRIKKLLNVLSILKNYKEDMKFPDGIYLEYANSKGKSENISDFENLDLKDFLKQNFPQNVINKIVKDLTNYTTANEEFDIDAKNKRYTVLKEKNGVIEDYNLGEELAYIRGLLLTSGTKKETEKNTAPYITKYSLETLRKLEITQIKGIDIGDSKKINELLDIFGKQYFEENKFEKVKGKMAKKNEEGFVVDEDESVFCISREKSKKSREDNFIRVNGKFNEYSWITGIKYGPNGCDKSGKLSQELIDSRKFIEEFMYGCNEDGTHFSIEQVLQETLENNHNFCDSNNVLINLEQAKGYIEICILNSIKYHPDVFFREDTRNGIEFEGVDSLLNPEFSTDKRNRISILAREIPSFKREYDKYLDKKIKEEEIKTDKSMLSKMSKKAGLTTKEFLEEVKKLNEGNGTKIEINGVSFLRDSTSKAIEEYKKTEETIDHKYKNIKEGLEGDGR